MNEDAKINIRQATIHDLEALCAVRNHQKLFSAYLEECDGESAYFLVAEIHKKIVGFGLLYLGITKNGKKKSHLPKLSDLFVHEEFRHQGVATALIHARELLAKQNGHAQLYVSIDCSDSLEMMCLANKLDYLPLQEHPYPVTALYYDAQGKPYEKQYFRQDFKKHLL